MIQILKSSRTAMVDRARSFAFWKPILIGQMLSLLLCGTGTTSALLATRYSFKLPCLQTFLNYLLLALVYTPVVLYRNELLSVFRNWWRLYLLLAFFDVEGNYLVVLAYRYTSLSSVALLSSISIVVCVLGSLLLLGVQYRRIHYVGIFLCMLGAPLLIFNDWLAKIQQENTNKNSTTDSSNEAPPIAQRPGLVLLGDVIAVGSAICYAASNLCCEHMTKTNRQHRISTEENLTLKSDREDEDKDRIEAALPVVARAQRVSVSPFAYLSLLGLFALPISATQVFILEWDQILATDWTPSIVWLFLGYTGSLFLFSSIVVLLIQQSSSVMLNISILTTNAYALIIALYLFHTKLSIFFLPAFVLVTSGMLMYNLAQPSTTSSETSPNTSSANESTSTTATSASEEEEKEQDATELLTRVQKTTAESI